LPEARRAEVEAYLASHPEDAERVAAYRRQNEALRAQFGPIADETVPERLQAVHTRRAQPWLRYAAVVAWMTLGGVIGWHLQVYHSAQRMESSAWARRAPQGSALRSGIARFAESQFISRRLRRNWLERVSLLALPNRDLDEFGHGVGLRVAIGSFGNQEAVLIEIKGVFAEHLAQRVDCRIVVCDEIGPSLPLHGGDLVVVQFHGEIPCLGVRAACRSSTK